MTVPIKSNLFCWTVQKPQEYLYVQTKIILTWSRKSLKIQTDITGSWQGMREEEQAEEIMKACFLSAFHGNPHLFFCEINGNHFLLFTTVLGSNYNSGRFRYNIAALLCSTFSLSITVLIWKYWKRSINSISKNTLSCIAKEGTMLPEIRRAWKSKNLLFFFSLKFSLSVFQQGHSPLQRDKVSTEK